jgi:DegV family protein with EDD domain
MAKIQVLEKYPHGKIEVIDSTHNTVCFGLFVNEIVRMREAGLSFNECLKKMIEIRSTGYIYFTIGSFNYLDKGGRLGKAAFIAGDKLGIKPVIIMANGGISVGGIKRSRKKAINRVLELVQEHFKANDINIEDYSFKTGYCYDKEEGEEFTRTVEELLGIECCSDFEGKIGPITGVHTGPYALGIGLIKRYDA